MAEGEAKSSNQVSPRFDHFVVELLVRNDGVFFGEIHDRLSLGQAVGKLLPYFKAHGVETFSIELPQNMVDEMKTIPDAAAFKQRWPRAADHMLGGFEVVKAAQKHGLQVLGHEIPYPEIMEKAFRSKQEGEGEALEEFERWATSEKGRNARNDFAASYIRANRKGKFLVLGGLNHSGNFTSADTNDPEWETDYGFKSQDTHAPYKGLDVKLGIPSIDYRTAKSMDQIGAVVKASGKFSTYEVALPEGELGGFSPSHSYPPPPSVKSNHSYPRISKCSPSRS